MRPITIGLYVLGWILFVIFHTRIDKSGKFEMPERIVASFFWPIWTIVVIPFLIKGFANGLKKKGERQ